MAEKSIRTEQRLCQNCGIAFHPSTMAGTRQRCCSQTCAAAWRRRTHPGTQGPFTCLHCQKVFLTHRHDAKTFCSRACSDAHRAVHGVPFKIVRQCENCGASYTIRGIQQRICSACRAAQDAAEKAWQVEQLCPICAGPFVPHRQGHIFCSLACLREHVRITATPISCICQQCGTAFEREKYAESDRCKACVEAGKQILKRQHKKIYKRTDRARKRGVQAERFSPDEIFERDRWRCQMCQRKVSRKHDVNHDAYPHLDHIIPLSINGLHTRANTQCLCRACNMAKRDTIPSGMQLRLLG